MKRRSRPGDEASNEARGPEALRTKRRDASTTVSLSASTQDAEVARLTRELYEARHQTATAEVLQVISSFPSHVKPVFSTMLEKAVRICEATFGNIYRWDGENLHLVADNRIPSNFVEARGRTGLHPGANDPVAV